MCARFIWGRTCLVLGSSERSIELCHRNRDFPAQLSCYLLCMEVYTSFGIRLKLPWPEMFHRILKSVFATL
jgi:hypothetical protein